MASASTSRDKILMSFAAQVGAASRHAQRLLAEAADEDCRLLEFFRLANALLAHLGQLLRPQMRADQRTLHRGLPSSCQQVLPLLAQLAVAPLPARPTPTSAIPSSSLAACSKGAFTEFERQEGARRHGTYGAMLRRRRTGVAGHAYRRAACTNDHNHGDLCYSGFFLPAADRDAVSRYVFDVSYYVLLAALRLDGPVLPATSAAIVLPPRSVMSDAAVAADLPLQSCGVVHVASGPDAARIVELNDNKRRWVSATMMNLLHDHGPQGVMFSDVYKLFKEAFGDLSDEVTREIRSIIEQEFLCSE